MKTWITNFLSCAVLLGSSQAMAYYPNPYQWRLADDVAHNGDSRTFCYAVNQFGQVLNQGNPIQDSYCSQPKPDLATYGWKLGDEVAHNGDGRTLCFAINPSTGGVLNQGNPISESYCANSPLPGYGGGQNRYDWRLGDDVAHNGDPVTYCFAFDSYGNVSNQGYPVNDAYCSQPKPNLATYRWILADEVAHNGDGRVLCFAVNAYGSVLNKGNPVNEAYCRNSNIPQPAPAPYLPPQPSPGKIWSCSTASNGRVFSTSGRDFEGTRNSVIRACSRAGGTFPAECARAVSCR